MQIVIDLPEEDYNTICRDAENSRDLDNPIDNLIVAVKDGTPLPKGHGRLIDVDKLELDDGYSNYDGYYHRYSQS